MNILTLQASLGHIWEQDDYARVVKKNFWQRE